MAVTTRTTMPGHWTIQSILGVCEYASIPLAVTSWTDSNMAASTSTSHFSTDPFAFAGSTLFLKGTVSFSTEDIPVISILGPSNTSLSTPSKHFFMWGCTLVGSLVSERISSISSFDRKKNLGKKSLFFSRYAARPF